MLFSGYTVQLGIFFYPLAALYLIGSINFVNLTDGIDGLASAVTTTCGMFFFLCGIAYGNPALQSGGALLAGCSLGFLFFNAHPAKVFMGDTGSLFLGALAVGCAFLSPTPLSLLPAGIVYYLEGASVILQVAVFKLTHRRLFRMAPLHHHFEKSGWSEWRVVLFFLTLSLLGDAVAFFSLPA